MNVVASGGFDPLHVGHVEYLERAKCLDFAQQLIVIVNSDDFLLRKKGFAFMPLVERVQIVRALRCVDHAIVSSDTDQSVCETLRLLFKAGMIGRGDVFANGGDRQVGGILEEEVCRELGIRIKDGLGEKIQSSSQLVKKLVGVN